VFPTYTELGNFVYFFFLLFCCL